MVVVQLTEDEANSIEDLEYLIDFDNWFSDVEFVNRIKRAKEKGRKLSAIARANETQAVSKATSQCSPCALFVLFCIIFSTCRVKFQVVTKAQVTL